MKAENDRLMADVEKLKQRLREEVTRTQAGVRLDLNLEKGRIRDESSQQELKIKEVDTRIESEIAGLRTQIEQAKFSILQYLVGVATGSGALLVSPPSVLWRKWTGWMLTLVCLQLAYMRMMVSGCGGNVRMRSRKADINFDGSDRSEICRGLIMLYPVFCTIHPIIHMHPSSLQPSASTFRSRQSHPVFRFLPGAFKMFRIHPSPLYIDRN